MINLSREHKACKKDPTDLLVGNAKSNSCAPTLYGLLHQKKIHAMQ